MMPKREERIEGTEFTKRRKVWSKFDLEEDGLAEAMRRTVKFSQDPWEAQRPHIDWVKRSLASEIERSDHKCRTRFKARDDAGWYLNELVAFADIADANIAKGDARWAAYAGAGFGELWSELQLKLAREELFLIGKKYQDCSDEGAAARRKGDQAERVREVDGRKPGTTKRMVYERIAKRQKVTWRAIEKDYLAAKKKNPTPLK